MAELVESGVYVAVRVSVPAGNDSAGTVMVTVPATSVVSGEGVVAGFKNYRPCRGSVLRFAIDVYGQSDRQRRCCRG